MIAALVALIAQATLPHLHLLQPPTGDTAEHWSRRSVSAPRAAVRVAAHAAAAQREVTRAGRVEHAESRCPICQTLAQSRDFLVFATTVPKPLHAPFATANPSRDAQRAPRAVAHAPRSPPPAA